MNHSKNAGVIEGHEPESNPFRKDAMTTSGSGKPIEILLVEDSPDYAFLTVEALKEGRVRNTVHVAEDGVEALEFLHHEGAYRNAPRPDLILLDLHLPKKDGWEVLAEIKADPELKRIPVVIMTYSDDEQHIIKAYNMHVNCYVTKPVDLDKFMGVVRSIEHFWFNIVKLPAA
jgi:chemotaxis family two-component system response regulator Rcp1